MVDYSWVLAIKGVIFSLYDVLDLGSKGLVVLFVYIDLVVVQKVYDWVGWERGVIWVEYWFGSMIVVLIRWFSVLGGVLETMVD